MKKYKNLQYLRVLACLGVVVTHLGQRLKLPSGIFNNFTHFGAMGVYMFFIISGFLGFYTYEHHNGGVRSYWIKRFFRIAPVYYAIILYDIYLYTFVIKDVPLDATGLGWARYFLFLNQCLPEKVFWRNLSATWTISVFVLFYLLMPLFKKVINSFNRSMVALLIFYFISQLMGDANEWFKPFYYIYFFIIGIIIYYAIKDHKENFACALFAIFMIIEMVIGNINATTYSFIFAIIIIVTSGHEFKSQRTQSVINTLDKYSFIIYLVHAIVMDAIDLMNDTYELSSIAIILITIIGTTVVSIFAYYCIDAPAQKLYEKLLGKMGKA